MYVYSCKSHFAHLFWNKTRNHFTLSLLFWKEGSDNIFREKKGVTKQYWQNSYSEHWNSGVKGVKLWGRHSSACTKSFLVATFCSFSSNDIADLSLVASLLILSLLKTYSGKNKNNLCLQIRAHIKKQSCWLIFLN